MRPPLASLWVCNWILLRSLLAGRASSRFLDQPPRQGKAMGRESLGLGSVRWAERGSGARSLRSSELYPDRLSATKGTGTMVV